MVHEQCRGYCTGIEMEILRIFERLGYSHLTPIQRKSIPILARRRDTLIVAPTGSGKTEAAMIPILTMVASRGTDGGRERDGDGVGRGRGIKVLYITPLRALNRDMLRRLVRYAEVLGLRVDVRHGDTSSYRRRKMQHDPPDVLITTPETLAIILVGGMGRALRDLEWVVIDELHELLSNKRGAHLALSIERVERLAGRRVTRVGLSATIGNLDSASRFISHAGGEQRTGGGVGGRGKSAVVVDDSLRRYDVDTVYLDAPMADIAKRIMEYVKSNCRGQSVLLFTNTRDEAEYMASMMRELSDSTVSVDVHHGSLSREVREEAERRLREKGDRRDGDDPADYASDAGHDGRTDVVVCTSSLELGIDVGSVGTVIHYGSPRQVAKMAQRIGRSRHRASESAKGVIFINSPDDEIEVLAILKRLADGDVEEQRVHDSPLDVLAHHIVGLALERYGMGRVMADGNNNDDGYERGGGKSEVSAMEVLEMARRAYQFRSLSMDDVAGCLEVLDRSGIVRFDRDRLVFRAAKSRAYYYDNASMIPDVLKFDVVDTARNRIIGSLDQEFVGDYGEQGNVFVLKGMQWRILAIDYSKRRVSVEPYYATSMNVPYWSGEMIPVEYATAQMVGRMRRLVVHGRSRVMSSSRILDAYKALGNTIPDDKTIVVEYTPNLVVIHACLGTRINNTLASLLSTIVSSGIGYTVNVRSDAYRIMLNSTARIGKRHIMDCLLGDYDVEEIVVASLRDTHNLNWSIWNVAKRFGLVDSDAVYDRRMARVIYERYMGTPVAREAVREVLHEKYDIDGARGVMERLRSGMMRMVWRDVGDGSGHGSDGSVVVDGQFSPLALPIMERSRVGGYSSPVSSEQALMGMVRDRLMRSRHRLVCLKCASSRIVEVSNAPEELSCPECKSRIVAAIHPYDDETYDAILLKVRNARLDGEQEHRFRRAWKSASLLHTFGRRALLVLSGYGIGVDTAARILRNYADEREEVLLKYIYEAERRYITTRGFWDD
ncbi:MAG: DEAD/DEAH box helicase [Candidatus Nitrosocaldus sp.]|nr:DEAD/DEAH box helicase [Candidatus Nitrosocaldus sp.]MDW8275809.1 DEAD/DEAH box helicase [Candidatus Nitrosocaldus sp.]